MAEYICPLACGYCCRTSWHSVRALVEEFPLMAVRAKADITDEECPYLDPNGCKLPREKRPETCLTFVCDLSAAVIEKRVTLKWAKEQMAKHDNNPLYVWNDYNNGEFQTALTEETWKQLQEIREKLNDTSEMRTD